MLYLSFFVGLCQILVCNCQTFKSPDSFITRFPSGGAMGIYVAVVFPIDLPGREASLGWFFEAIHPLPDNNTQFTVPVLEGRMDKIDRKHVYTVVENRIKSKGYSGKECLLRAICEVASYPLQHSNGLIGDLLQIFLSPSSSKNIDLPSEYTNAELLGKSSDNCTNYFKNCSVSLMELFTKLSTY
ncbi:unnamed protein product [Phyllotreta striolata]|uniref:Uncharacterized protein n=1 Tax=Phyllotreta striolata TaxID=444603 RepID=A0A9N9XMW2_PHYSR|nr:unnamed protein product [Phyllotreta striolata]